MTIDELRSMTRFIEERLPGASAARFSIDPKMIELEVKMADGRRFYDALDLDAVAPELREPVMQGFCDGVHKFVREMSDGMST